uniref:Uncharacterized protein n=1 Tax=viral metagenome TaxID=1070528 RepID=A0A6M3J4R6_9ZZZZ
MDKHTEWKDTITHNHMGTIEELEAEQAEISFRAGMQEVVDFIVKEILFASLNLETRRFELFLQSSQDRAYDKWQAFIKEHGLEN